jgi:predicted ATP-dependent protease
MQVKPVDELKPDDLYQRCDPDRLPFQTTQDLEPLNGSPGQPRALEALRFGVGIDRDGYNVFAFGAPGTGKHTMVRQVLEEQAAREQPPEDLCYVNNFEQRHKPRVLRLPAGKGKEIAREMDKLLEEVVNALRSAFENEEFQNRSQDIAQEFQEKQQNAFQELRKEGEERGLSVVRTPMGIVFAPVRDGEVIGAEEFQKLPEEERHRVEQKVQELQKKAQSILQAMPSSERQLRDKLNELTREIARMVVSPLVAETKEGFGELKGVVEYLEAVERDIVQNVRELLRQGGDSRQLQGPQAQLGAIMENLPAQWDSSPRRRYQINLLVDHSESRGAPVVYEDNPTYQNLIGRVEHLAHMGALMTDFNMIRPGALHRANGGYLILDALKVLTQPFAWEGLKRALKSKDIRIESLSQIYSLISTVTLEPEPVPLDVKIAMLGPPQLYYLLRDYDPEFAQLFKVAADFDSRMDRTPENEGISTHNNQRPKRPSEACAIHQQDKGQQTQQRPSSSEKRVTQGRAEDITERRMISGN